MSPLPGVGSNPASLPTTMEPGGGAPLTTRAVPSTTLASPPDPDRAQKVVGSPAGVPPALAAGLAETPAVGSRRWTGPTLTAEQLVSNFLGGDSGPTVLKAFNPDPSTGSPVVDVTKPPLVVVPGRFQNLDEYKVLVRHFASEGRQLYFLLYDSARRDPTDMAREMGLELARLQAFYGRRLPLDVVAHSQGGLEMQLALAQLQSGAEAGARAGFGRVRMAALDSPWAGVADLGFAERLVGGANIGALEPTSPFMAQVRRADADQVQLRTYETLEEDGYVRGLVDLPDEVVRLAATRLTTGETADSDDARVTNVVAWLRHDERSATIRERLALRLEKPAFGALVDLLHGVLRDERTPGDQGHVAVWQIQPERARLFLGLAASAAALPPESVERVALDFLGGANDARRLDAAEQTVRAQLDENVKKLGWGAKAATQKQLERMMEAGAAHALRSVARDVGMLSDSDHRGILKDATVLRQISQLFAEPR